MALVTIGAWAVVAALAGQSDPKAVALLQKSMQRTFSVNVVALIEQRDPTSDRDMQLVKVERSKTGKVRHSILKPMRLQGTMSIDDGERAMMYLPDEKIIINQESSQAESNDVSFRMDLAVENYDFRLEKGVTIAGRSTSVVMAIPKESSMDGRRYFLDEKTAYPLKLDVVSTRGGAITQYETKDIKYPTSLDEATFKMRVVGGVSTLKYKKPDSLKNSRDAEKVVGFIPIVPNALPLGFRVQNVQVNESPEWRSVALRITDGLVRATVYQWKSTGSDDQIQAMDNRSIGLKKGIRIMIVSDLGAPLRTRLLRAFLSLAGENGPVPGKLQNITVYRVGK